MNITPDVKFLRGLMPKAVITAIVNDKGTTDYECDLRHTKLEPSEHDAFFEPIKNYFGNRLSERYSYCTGHFMIYTRKENDVRNN